MKCTHKTIVVVMMVACVLGAGAMVGFLIWEPVSAHKVESQTYDFGTARAGQQIEHTFIITNPLPTALEIAGMRTSCGCMLPKGAPTRIGARASCDMPIVLSTDGHSGPLSQRCVVSFKNHGPITLSFSGTVIKDVPDRLTFPAMKDGDKKELSFVVTPFPGEDFAIHRVQYDQKYLEVAYTPVIKDHRVIFTVRMNKGIPQGPYDKLLTIYTNDKFSPIKRVFVSGYILRSIEVEPAKVALGIVAPNESKSDIVTLVCPYGERIAIDHIDSPPSSHIAWRILPTSKDEKSAKVEVTLNAKPKGNKPEVICEELRIYAHAGETYVRSNVMVSALIP